MAHSTQQINRSLLAKTVADFYVSFYGLPENISNILGRQVKSIERPTITFNTYERFNKGIRQQDTGRILFEPISITFEDDENSLVTQGIYNQIMRQSGALSPSFESTFFEVGVKVYNGSEEVVEEFKLIDCFFSNITHAESILTDATENVITATVGFNNLEYNFPLLDETIAVDFLVDENGNFIVDRYGNFIVS